MVGRADFTGGSEPAWGAVAEVVDARGGGEGVGFGAGKCLSSGGGYSEGAEREEKEEEEGKIGLDRVGAGGGIRHPFMWACYLVGF